ncbi:MAG TPA: hypothetical protein VJC09_02165 [Candidatus Saccharimonadales bacterium]|nr:hypothetical protein [Candidatus Saccharimonadales bacterium]
MDPNAPPAPPPAPLPNGAQPTPYDFIMNPERRPKKPSLFGGGGGSKTTKLVLVGAGGVVLLLVAVVFISFLDSATKGKTQTLLGIAQQQQEIIRVADLGIAEGSTTPDTKNLATTTKITLQTSQKAIMALVVSNGQKEAAATLGAKKDEKTDAQLTTSKQTGFFDKTFIQIFERELRDYSALLQETYKSSKSKPEKELLQSSYNDITLILGDPVLQNN